MTNAAETTETATPAAPAKRKRKPAPTPLERELASIEHALSDDTTRPHLCKPFSLERRGVGYLAAADGHRAALVRSVHWRDFVRSDAPRLDAVLDSLGTPTHVGEIDARKLDDEARTFPAKWQVGLTFGQAGDERGTIHARVVSGRTKRIVYPIGRALCTDWAPALAQLRHRMTVHLPYLLDGVDFVRTGLVQVLSGGELEPIVLLPYGAKSIDDAERFEVVMPRRE